MHQCQPRRRLRTSRKAGKTKSVAAIHRRPIKCTSADWSSMGPERARDVGLRGEFDVRRCDHSSLANLRSERRCGGRATYPDRGMEDSALELLARRLRGQSSSWNTPVRRPPRWPLRQELVQAGGRRLGRAHGATWPRLQCIFRTPAGMSVRRTRTPVPCNNAIRAVYRAEAAACRCRCRPMKALCMASAGRDHAHVSTRGAGRYLYQHARRFHRRLVPADHMANLRAWR